MGGKWIGIFWIIVTNIFKLTNFNVTLHARTLWNKIHKMFNMGEKTDSTWLTLNSQFTTPIAPYHKILRISSWKKLGRKISENQFHSVIKDQWFHHSHNNTNFPKTFKRILCQIISSTMELLQMASYDFHLGPVNFVFWAQMEASWSYHVIPLEYGHPRIYWLQFDI